MALAAMASGAAAATTPAAPSPAGASVTSPTIQTPDGVRLAADLVLPAGAAAKRLPAILVMTPYGRATRLSGGAVQAFTVEGFAIVLVDTRGTGASQGHVTAIFSRQERADIGVVLGWIARQPWSDGRVVATGASYDGNLAALSLAAPGKAMAGAVPRFIDFDTYRDLAVPGGVRNEMLLREWGAMTDALDRATPCLLSASACPAMANLKPVDGDTGDTALRAALLDHQQDWRAYADTRGYQFEDDRTSSGHDLRDGFLSTQTAALRASRVPVQLWGSWFDAATADSALDWYRAAPDAPIELYLGAWTHGGGARVDPFVRDAAEDEPGAPSPARTFLGFAEDAVTRPAAARRLIHYYTAGAQRWRTTTQWPPAGVRPVRWFFAAGGALDRTAPTQARAADTYAVDFTATTGKTNRWTTQLGGGPVDYGDRAGPDRRLLTYTSAPLDRDIEVTGSAVVNLPMASSRPDGAVFVYLEAVGPDGRVVYLSEGDLRLALRGPASPANTPAGVAPSFLRADAAPLVPGAMTEIGLRLHAVSALVRTGYRLRLAIAGADADTFARYPESGDLTYTIRRSAAAPAWVELPQADWTGADAGVSSPAP
ncbi:MAG TPA: CocE/NonD family hydrolase [Caulobacteraceae bacterium]|nr:CocE/NonD family hydrolase [Caulobacteraceae bacterium]